MFTYAGCLFSSSKKNFFLAKTGNLLLKQGLGRLQIFKLLVGADLFNSLFMTNLNNNSTPLVPLGNFF